MEKKLALVLIPPAQVTRAHVDEKLKQLRLPPLSWRDYSDHYEYELLESDAEYAAWTREMELEMLLEHGFIFVDRSMPTDSIRSKYGAKPNLIFLTVDDSGLSCEEVAREAFRKIRGTVSLHPKPR
ncbi:hypothetical protein [Pseudomonas sp. TWP3-2]|uniref:hypothetical protein n=1 Tax=Pseudomonas sp. TWP3-2 TaxID=2804574 RepID=UPI003CF1EF59